MAYATVTLTGTYQTPDGTPHKGHVEIIPSERVIKDTTGDIILTGRVKVDLDAQGAFTVVLPATDDDTLNPTGFGYTIAAKLHSSHPPAVSFSLPAALGATTVEDVTPVDPSTFAPTTTYAETSTVAALDSRVTTLETTPTVTSYNDLTDTPSLATVATTGNYSDLAGQPAIPSTPGEVGAEPAGLSQSTLDTIAATYAPQAALSRFLPGPAGIPTTMSSPPTITGPYTTGTTIPSSTVVTADTTSAFAYTGTTPKFAGTSYPDNLFYVAQSGQGSPPPWTVRFAVDSAKIELRVKGTGGKIRVLVDGKYAHAPLALPAGGDIFLVSVDFGTRDHRQIAVEGYPSFYFGGVRIGPTDSIWADPLPGPKAVVLGDSFTEPTIIDTATSFGADQGYPFILGRLMGWSNTIATGSGGTGYLTPGAAPRVKFRDRYDTDVVPHNPDIVIYAGGINDASGTYSGAQVQTEAELLFAHGLDVLPDAQHIVISPWWKDGNPPTGPNSVTDIRDGIKAAALANGLPFVDVLNPVIWTGNGDQGAPTGSGNADLYVGGDGTHPTIEGHRYIAKRLYQLLRAQGVG